MSSTSISYTVPEDGYDWLKYGQKYCQGESSTRLYYRCKENKDLNCPARKIVDCHEGGTDKAPQKSQYIEDHNHSPRRHSPSEFPESNKNAQIDAADGLFQSKETTAEISSRGTRPKPNRQGKKLTQSLRSEVEKSLVDAYASFTLKKTPVDDGYAWLKYGQKTLYGNVFTRTYYRCRMHKSLNCTAKKTLDTINNSVCQGQRVFYHGQHNHPSKVEPTSSRKQWSSSEMGGSNRPKSNMVDALKTFTQNMSGKDYAGKPYLEPLKIEDSSSAHQQLKEQHLRFILESCGQTAPTTSNQQSLLLAQLAQLGNMTNRRPHGLATLPMTPLATPSLSLFDILNGGLLSPGTSTCSGSEIKFPLDNESPSSPLLPNIFQEPPTTSGTPSTYSLTSFQAPKPPGALSSSPVDIVQALLAALSTSQPPTPTAPHPIASFSSASSSTPAAVNALAALHNLSQMEFKEKKDDCNLELTLGRN